MSIQGQFDRHALMSLPKICDIIKASDKSNKMFEKNQIICLTLREMMNTRTPVDNMSIKQLHEFEEYLIEIFKSHKWI